MKRQWDKGLEPPDFVLQRANPNQVVDAMPGFLDVAIKHGGVGAQAELVSFPMNANPGVGVGLMLADFVADFGMEDFRPAARQAAETGLFKFGENVARRPSGHP